MVTTERRFEVWQRRRKKDGRPCGKHHIAAQHSPDALCGKDIDIKPHRRVVELCAIEDILKHRVDRPEILCKSCVRAARRYRNPLDRLAEL